MLPLSNEPLVTVCATASLLVHFTVVFTLTVIDDGLNAVFCMNTSLAGGVPEPEPEAEEELLCFLHPTDEKIMEAAIRADRNNFCMVVEIGIL